MRRYLPIFSIANIYAYPSIGCKNSLTLSKNIFHPTKVFIVWLAVGIQSIIKTYIVRRRRNHQIDAPVRNLFHPFQAIAAVYLIKFYHFSFLLFVPKTAFRVPKSTVFVPKIGLFVLSGYLCVSGRGTYAYLPSVLTHKYFLRFFAQNSDSCRRSSSIRLHAIL